MQLKKRKRYKDFAKQISIKTGVYVDLNCWDSIWNLVKKYDEPVFTYFIGNKSNNTVKIGKSVSPGARLKQLQTGCPDQLVLYRFVSHESPFTEKELHKKFFHLRVSGEWFRYTDELANFVKDISY